MTTIERTSLVSGEGHRVSVDPYGANPLAQDYQQVNPENYQVSTAKAGPPPKMFSGGATDLPAFTASGVDPRMLLQLPYTARHYVAAEPDPAKVHAIFEEHAGDPDLHFDHAGLRSAVARVRDWAAGRMDTNPEAIA